MSEKILDIKEERLSFFTPAGEVKALNGVSFTMNQGDVLGVVGESGSGKSVTAYSVMGLTAYPGKLVGGKVWFNGHEIENMKEKDFRKIRGNEVSIIFQDPMTSPVSSRVTPYADRQRDITSDQMDKSRRVYPTIVGLPVVPEEACTRTTSEGGAAISP